jgi:hypothetical protein
MNYFAHGIRFLDNPYMLAGTAVPDWLSVANRKVRVRQRQAALFIEDADPMVAALARGIVQHHRDDAWFHATVAFGELSWRLTMTCRDVLPDDPGFRPSFLGHILVELLLDAALAKKAPAQLDRYYATMASIDAVAVEAAVNRMAIAPAEQLGWFIGKFCEVRFLWDYSDDERLLFRLNQVLDRVGLETLPEKFMDVLGPARRTIAAEVGRLAPGYIEESI